MTTDGASGGERVLGLGLVGLGGAALSMLPKMTTNPRFRIAAVADIDEGILSSFKQDHPEATTYTDMKLLCQDEDVDLVYIATPNRLHTEHAMAAFDAGKHVLIEKPMTIEIPSALEMVEAAEKRGRSRFP